MKTGKLFVVALALVLTLCMTATAFAASGDDTATGLPYTNNTIDVTGTYSGSSIDGVVYSVDISWGAMDFTYKVVNGTKWDPSTHQYNAGEAPHWTASGNTITTVNHSDAPVDVALTFTKNPDLDVAVDTFEGTISNANYNLITAVGTKVNEAPSGTSELTITGALASEHTTQTTLGTITVNLSAPVVQP